MIQSKSDLRLYIREDKKRNLGAYKVGFVKYIAYWLYGTDQMKAYRLLRALRRTEYAKNCLIKKGIFGKLIYAFRQYRYHRLEERYDISIGTNMVGYGFKLPHVVGGGIIINCNSMGNYCGANVGGRCRQQSCLERQARDGRPCWAYHRLQGNRWRTYR